MFFLLLLWKTLIISYILYKSIIKNEMLFAAFIFNSTFHNYYNGKSLWFFFAVLILNVYFSYLFCFGTGEFLNIYQKNIYKYYTNLHCSVVIYIFLNLFSFFFSPVILSKINHFVCVNT